MKNIMLIAKDKTTQQVVKACLKGTREFHVARCHSTAADALRDFPARAPDLVLIEDRFADTDGVEALDRIRKIDPKVPCVVFCSTREMKNAVGAFAAGARGFFVLPADPRSLAQALHDVSNGHFAFPVDVQEMIVTNLLKVQRELLSPKEKEILERIANKMQDKEIAQATNKATGTVHVIVSNIFKKLGVHSRRDAAAAYLGLRPVHELPHG